MGRNTNGPPRNPMLQALLCYNREERVRINADAGRDWGKDMVMQFGNLQELNRCVDVQLSLGTYVSIRTWMDLILAQYMMLRGEDCRHVEFPDIFTIDSLNEGHKGDVPMLILWLGQGKVFFSLYSIDWLMNRPIVMEKLNMASHFVIRMYNIVLWVLLHFTYIIDSMLKGNHGLIFRIDRHGIRRSCLQNQAMCMRRLQINLIEKFAIWHIKKRDVRISMEHILLDMKDVKWLICWMYPMHRLDVWDDGITVEWHDIIHQDWQSKELEFLQVMDQILVYFPFFFPVNIDIDCI